MNLTDNNFHNKVIANPQPVLVMFEASWSGSSHIMTPIINEMVKTHAGRVEFGTLDVERELNTPVMFGIKYLPSLLLFRNGREINRISEAISQHELEDKLKELI